MENKKLTYLNLFDFKHFKFLWIGQTLSQLGNQVYLIAFFWLVAKKVNIPWQAGIIVFLASIPYLIFGLPGGVYSDRFSRKSVMMVCDIIRAIVVLTIYILYSYESLKLWHLGISAFILTSTGCFFKPAFRASIPSILPKEGWATANSLIHASLQICNVIGPVIATFIIEYNSLGFIFIFNTLTFVVAIILLIPIQIKHENDSKIESNSMLNEIRDAFSIVRPNKVLFQSILFFVVGLVFMSSLNKISGPMISEQIWKTGARGFGLLMTGFGIGNILSALFIGKIKIKRYGIWIFSGWVFWGIFYAAIGISPVFILGLLFSILSGMAEAMIDIPMVNLIVESTPPDKHGRVFSIWSTTAFIGESFSPIYIGLITSLLGIKESYWFSGGALAFLALIILLYNLKTELKL